MNTDKLANAITIIERIIYKNGDDIAISLARAFERLEERIDLAETRIYNRIGDLESTGYKAKKK